MNEATKGIVITRRNGRTGWIGQASRHIVADNTRLLLLDGLIARIPYLPTYLTSINEQMDGWMNG